MGFSKDVRNQALVAAARHCCLCHRFKGVNVEVHHIVPEASGGSNDFDNAIVLCFDCHADVGHYNDRHPRGTKFSPEELKAHRDAWYEMVKNHNIQPLHQPDFLYCRYLICKSFGVLREICQENLSRLPFDRTLLIKNLVLDFQLHIINAHPTDFRHARVWGDSYPDLKSYDQAHPDSTEIDKHGVEFPRFERVRTPTRREILTRVANADGVTQLLLRHGIPVERVACALAYWEKCGENRFQEIYLLRPLRGVFLAVTNISGKLLRLKSIEASVAVPVRQVLRSLEKDRPSQTSTLALPAAKIAPDTTVLIPLATVLAPLEHIPETRGVITRNELEPNYTQELAHVTYPTELMNSFDVWGPAIYPNRIHLDIDRGHHCQFLHELDFSNVYTLDRYWEIGSCPHLFFRRKRDGKLAYAGELFTGVSSIMSEITLRVPKSVCGIVVAEFQNECTYFHSVILNGVPVLEHLRLREDEYLEFEVDPGAELTMKGFYFPAHLPTDSAQDPWRQNALIGNFMTSY